MPTWLRPSLILAALALIFFAKLVGHPGDMLYSDYSDLVADHLPEKQFLVRSWQQTGEVPLWCPYMFGGAPFLHDPTMAPFYPLHLPLYLMPAEWLGAALSWLVVIHVMVAGWAMYAYARWQGLQEVGALVAAIGYMFAGSWLLHILGGGHYIVLGLAWVPLVLLWLEQAIQTGSLLRATWAGTVYGMITIGTHSQFTFYAGVFIAFWTLGPMLETAGYLGAGGPRSAWRMLKALGRWLGFGVWTVLIAAGLSSIQLLPTWEATQQSSRTLGVPVRPEMWADVLKSLSAVVGPALGGDPAWQWEDRPGLSLIWLVLAIVAPSLGWQPRRRFQAVLCLTWFAVGILGGPLLQQLPGFQLFQLPTRLCLLGTLPVALLAGSAIQRLVAEPAPAVNLLKRNRRLLLLMTVLAATSVAAVAALLRQAGESVHWAPYWLTLAFTIPAAWWLLGRPTFLAGRSGAIAWNAVLILDLWGISWPLVDVRSPVEIYEPSESVKFLAGKKEEHGRVLDVPPTDRSLTMTPLWPSFAVATEIESLRGFKSLDILRYKEYLQFMTDHDEPLRPLESPFTKAILDRFPVRNQKLADLLGVRYLVQPSGMPLEATIQDKAGRDQWQKAMADATPRCFSFMSGNSPQLNSGIQRLPPYTVYENRSVLPRAFVVPHMKELAGRGEVLSQLKSTDFRREVLLEDYEPHPLSRIHRWVVEGHHPAEIREYSPNRVVIHVESGRSDYLVLTDIWFPGWKCEVNGLPVPISFFARWSWMSPDHAKSCLLSTPIPTDWGKTSPAAR